MIPPSHTRLRIKKILTVIQKGDIHITTALFNDGGEQFQATGVGKDYIKDEEVVVYHDDKWNRFKFYRPKS